MTEGRDAIDAKAELPEPAAGDRPDELRDEDLDGQAGGAAVSPVNATRVDPYKSFKF